MEGGGRHDYNPPPVVLQRRHFVPPVYPMGKDDGPEVEVFPLHLPSVLYSPVQLWNMYNMYNVHEVKDGKPGLPF